MSDYEVIVSNLGTVWEGANGAQANVEFGRWKEVSKSGSSRRAEGEDVTLMKDGEPHFEYRGKLARDEDRERRRDVRAAPPCSPTTDHDAAPDFSP